MLRVVRVGGNQTRALYHVAGIRLGKKIPIHYEELGTLRLLFGFFNNPAMNLLTTSCNIILHNEALPRRVLSVYWRQGNEEHLACALQTEEKDSSSNQRK